MNYGLINRRGAAVGVAVVLIAICWIRGTETAKPINSLDSRTSNLVTAESRHVERISRHHEPLRANPTDLRKAVFISHFPESKCAASLIKQVLEEEGDCASDDRIRKRVRSLLRDLDRAQVVAMAWQAGKIPASLLPTDQEDLADFFTRWIRVWRTGAVTSDPDSTPKSSPEPVSVSFLERIDESSGSQNVFMSGTRRIYGVFERDGLGSVLAVWRDENNPQAVFQECEPIHKDRVFNYVWFEPSEHWPPGRYRLELYDPSNGLRFLGSGMFEVN